MIRFKILYYSKGEPSKILHLPSNFKKGLKNNCVCPKADLTMFMCKLSTYYIISLDDKNAFWPK